LRAESRVRYSAAFTNANKNTAFALAA